MKSRRRIYELRNKPLRNKGHKIFPRYNREFCITVILAPCCRRTLESFRRVFELVSVQVAVALLHVVNLLPVVGSPEVVFRGNPGIVLHFQSLDEEEIFPQLPDIVSAGKRVEVIDHCISYRRTFQGLHIDNTREPTIAKTQLEGGIQACSRK